MERNLSADAAKILEKNKSVKRKDDLRKLVVDGLSSLGYDSSICKSKWDKTRSIPAGTISINRFASSTNLLMILMKFDF